MRTLLRILTGLLVGAGLVSHPGPAAAGECTGQTIILDNGGQAEGDCYRDTPGRIGYYREATEEEEWRRYCTYQTDSGVSAVSVYIDGAEADIAIQGQLNEDRVEALRLDPTGEYGSLTVLCRHPAGPGSSGFGGEFIYTITDPTPLVDLRALAKAKIIIPDPPVGSNPSFTDRHAVVRIETWLWTDAAYWVPLDASETAGFVTVDVFATPNRQLWEFSDGTSTICDDEGSPWAPADGDRAADCGVTFTKSSAGEPNDAFQGEATAEWIFTWALNGVDQGEFDGPFLATTNLELQVGEILAVSS